MPTKAQRMLKYVLYETGLQVSTRTRFMKSNPLKPSLSSKPEFFSRSASPRNNQSAPAVAAPRGSRPGCRWRDH